MTVRQIRKSTINPGVSQAFFPADNVAAIFSCFLAVVPVAVGAAAARPP